MDGNTIVLAKCLLILGMAAIPGCSQDYTYHLYPNARTWNEARCICENLYQELLKFASNEESNVVNTIFSANWGGSTVPSEIWTGAYDKDHSNGNNKEEYVWRPDESPAHFTLHGTRSKKCVTLSSSPQLWTKQDCNSEHAFVCQEKCQAGTSCLPAVVETQDFFAHTISDALPDVTTPCQPSNSPSSSASPESSSLFASSLTSTAVSSPSTTLESSVSSSAVPSTSSSASLIILSTTPSTSTSLNIASSSFATLVSSVEVSSTIPADIPSTAVISATSTLASSLLVSETVSTTVQQVTSPTTQSLCSCRCKTPQSTTSTEELTKKIVEELKVDKSSTSASRRTKESAPDERKSAQTLGAVGIVIICLVFGLVLVVDLPRAIIFVQSMRNSETGSSKVIKLRTIPGRMSRDEETMTHGIFSSDSFGQTVVRSRSAPDGFSPHNGRLRRTPSLSWEGSHRRFATSTGVRSVSELELRAESSLTEASL